MRIVHATNSALATNNAPAATLGVEKDVTNLAGAQKARGSDVVIAVDHQGVFTETCRDHGIPVMAYDCLGANAGGRARTPGGNSTQEDSVQVFVDFLESFKPDIIHCNSPRAAWTTIVTANRMNIPCAFTVGLPVTSIEGRRKGLRFATLCITEATFKELLKSEIPDTDVYYVPNGTKVAPTTRALQPRSSRSPNLTMAGSLVGRKATEVAILAMFELRRRLGLSCPLLNIYGDGPRLKYLTEMSTVLGLNDIVRFHGFKIGILEQCPSDDILVMSSRQEWSPLVVLEAMSRGMPIVATDVGEVTKMLPDRRFGQVIPPDSVVALADAVETLLVDISSGQFDPDLLIKRHRSIYSLEKWAERTEAAYNQILLNSSATTREVGD
jgi:glycosyltransferase involved in cell wall biosynthesis